MSKKHNGLRSIRIMLLNLRIKIRRRDVVRVEISSMEAKGMHGEILINTLSNYDMDIMEKTISIRPVSTKPEFAYRWL